MEIIDLKKAVQKELGLEVDGIDGTKTWTAIYKKIVPQVIVSPPNPISPSSNIIGIGEKSLRLILSFEGMDQPYLWPGESSGVTIGRGYDLGFENSFKQDWGDKLDSDTINRLSEALGVSGERAHQLSHKFRDIHIKESDADKVFSDHTLPKSISQTMKAFPNSDKLPPEAFGALVSIVFNRGALIDDSDRRKEMKVIRDILILNPSDILKQIATQVKSMARLWPDNTNSDRDLHDRRLAEAKLIEGCIV